MNETDINVLCRLCLNKSYFYSNIYVGQSSDNTLFYEDINFVYDLQIYLEDGLPEYICQRCLAMVKRFKSYKTHAQLAKVQLMDMKQKMVRNDIEEGDIRSAANFVGLKEEVSTQHNSSEIKIFIKQETVDSEECSFYKEMSHEGNEVVSDVQADADPLLVDSGCNNNITKISNWSQEYEKHLPQAQEHEQRETKKYICKDCGTGYKQKSCFLRHIICQKTDSPHMCDWCRMQFTCKSKFMEHLKMHAKDRIRTYQCNECNKDFSKKSEIRKHIRLHKRDDPLQCNLCKKVFNSRSTYYLHKKTHEGYLRFACFHCNKRYRFRSRLFEHMKEHGEYSPYEFGDRPFACNQCDKKFNFRDSLMEHMNIHTGLKPYQCDICDSNFHTKYHLMRHSSIHTRAHSVE